MTDSRPLDRALAAYLAEGVNELADRVLEAALIEIDHTNQRRHLLATWRFPTMNSPMRAGMAAVIGVLVIGIVAYLLQPRSTVGPSVSPTSAPTAAPTQAATAAATQAAWTVLPPPSVDHNNNGNVIALADGRVLAVGGGDPATNVAEVFDPATRTWTTTAPMSTGRSYAVAARLADGRVLVAGGAPPEGSALASAEIWDPETGLWTATGSMTRPRGQAFGVALADGTVLVAGGGDAASGTSAEIYDPVAGTWASTGSLIVGRASAQIPKLLADGKMLIVGGFVSSGEATEAELYNPVTRTWETTGRASTPKGDEQTSVTLPDGRIMFFAGATTVDIYDPTTGTWSPGTPPVLQHGDYLASTMLATGRALLVAGGQLGEPAAAEYFEDAINPAERHWVSAGTTVAASFIRSAILLPDGSVLIIGSDKAGGGVPLAELYRPD